MTTAAKSLPCRGKQVAAACGCCHNNTCCSAVLAGGSHDGNAKRNVTWLTPWQSAGCCLGDANAGGKH